MMDKDTGRPRGFGFVTFDGDAAVDATLAGPLQILGKPIEVKRAQPRGNLRDADDDKKFGRGGKFGARNDNQSNYDQQAQNINGGQQQMSPAMMAQYWQRMQQYFSAMQQTIASQQSMQNPMAAMGAQMNPAMMQPMMAAMQPGANRPQTGSPQPVGPNNMGQMNPAMLQQMQQMGQMGVPQQQQGGGGYASPTSLAGNGRPAYNAQEQLAFEQQKYEQQQQRRMQQAAGYGGQGGVTSWDGMYDDMPQPQMPPQGPAATRMNPGYGRGGGGPHSRGRQGSSQPPVQPSNAPANAPTGPKNAGKPGANYRGGGRAHGGRGYHPYHRG
jgi:RNA-binding protein Musashi